MTAASSVDPLSCDLEPEVEAQGVKEILAGLTEAEKLAMPDPDMPVRHFRAEKGDSAKALKQIKETLEWRKEFQVETLRDCFHTKDDNYDDDDDDKDEKKDNHVDTTKLTSKEFRDIMLHENCTGKIYVRGYDKDGRAVVHMRPALENTNNELNNVRHLVYHMEKAIAVAQRNGHSKIVFVVDYEGFSLRKAPPLSTTRYTLEVMQRHYPERCHRFYLTHPPFAMRAFWTIVKPFVDAHTKEKINYCSGAKGIAWLVDELGGDPSKQETWAGGTAQLKPYNMQEYFDRPLNEAFDDELWNNKENPTN